MSESEASMLPLLAIGGLAIGAAVLLPSLLNRGGESVDYERAIEMARKLRQSDKRREELGMYPPDRDRLPLLMGGGKQEDDAYLITDEDFSKLDIGKKDRRWLNKERKIRDARLERVVYGDSMSLPPPPAQSFFVNTVSPYGQGPAHEFTRLTHPQDMSRTNTRTNTVNLY